LDVPSGLELGIDFTSYNTGPLFKGIKMIPPGLHFVFYSTGLMREGFFLHSKQGEVFIRRWDASTEDFAERFGIGDEDQEERLALGVRNFDFDKNLAAYPFEHYDEWKALSYLISEKVLKRVSISLGMKVMPGDVDDEE